MTKGLFLGFPGHGHVNPTIGLIKELVSKGDTITYYCTEEFKDKILPTGAKFISYEAITVEDATEGNYINSLKHLTSICSGLLEALWKTKEDHYDYMIYDSMINIGDKIGELLEIKSVIRSITTFAFSNVMLENLRNHNMNMLLNFNPKEIHEVVKSIQKKYKINFLNSFIKSLTNNKANLNIVFTSKYFQPRIEDFDESYKFIGPSIYDRKELSDFKIDNPENKKLLFISLGTVANRNFNFYQESFKAFKNRDDLLVIMSIGKKNKISNLGEIPSNFLIYNYVPQLDLLKKVDFFITHGGMNSTSEGLYNNLPLIVVPQFGDQFIVGKRIEELKAGINLHTPNISSAEILTAFNKISSEKYFSENAKIIGDSLREAGSYKKAVLEIHNLIKNKGL